MNESYAQSLGVVMTERRRFLPTGPVAFGVWSRIIAAWLSMAAGAIHFAVIREHFAEYALFGGLFAALAWFQGGWALAYIARPISSLAIVALFVNAGAIVVWALSRMAGLPIGPEPWIPEAVGTLDVLASTIEAALLVLLGIAVLPSLRGLRRDLTVRSATAFVGSAVIIVVVLTTIALTLQIGSHG